MNKKTLRPAIAMLELIFALVIIGLVLMTAPMLIQQAAKSAYVSVQQEAINEAASQVNMIMGHHWDESDTDEMYLDPILKVSSHGDPDLNENNVSGHPTGRRLGTPQESYRTFVRADGQRFNASTLGHDVNDRDDIDDFIGDTNLTLIDYSTADYIEKTTIKINTTVRYIDDNSMYNSPASGVITFSPDFTSAGSTLSTASTNIKRIIVTLTSESTPSESAPDELDKNIILRAFSCNIGGYKLEEKDF